MHPWKATRRIAYRFDNHGITTYVKNVVGMVDDDVYENFGPDSILVENDQQMVEKVASDPYGIGDCSSAFVDPERVVVLGIDLVGDNGAYDEGDAIWPTANEKSRWTMLALEDTKWPWLRALNVACDFDYAFLNTDGTSGGTGIATNLRATDGTGFMANLHLGPYFKVGYWPGQWWLP